MKKDRTVIITGGNSGLGYECARSILLADDGWHVVIAGRSLERIESSVQRLVTETGNPQVEGMQVDLASQASIRQFVEDVATADRPPIAALVANAGVQLVGPTETTRDGIEATFGVNHLGHFLLTNRLLSSLQAPARIVFVSSGTHDPAQKTGMPAPVYQEPHMLAFPEEEPGESPTRIGQRRYTTSKLCNVLCAYELDRRLKAEGLDSPERRIDVFAFDPGLMPGTGLARDYGPVLRFVWFALLPVARPLLRWMIGNVHTPAESGEALARLVLDPALTGQGGRYFEGMREIRSSLESYDEANAAELWDGSAELVGIPETLSNVKTNSHSQG